MYPSGKEMGPNPPGGTPPSRLRGALADSRRKQEEPGSRAALGQLTPPERSVRSGSNEPEVQWPAPTRVDGRRNKLERGIPPTPDGRSGRTDNGS